MCIDSDAFDLHYGVGILRLAEGLDYSQFAMESYGDEGKKHFLYVPRKNYSYNLSMCKVFIFTWPFLKPVSHNNQFAAITTVLKMKHI